MIEIKKLSADSWEDYKKLRLQALNEDPSAFGKSPEEESNLSEEEWKIKMQNVVFALDDNKPIGMTVYVFDKKIKCSHIANIYGVYISKEHRRKGIGNLLMTDVLKRIKENSSIIKVKLAVNSEQKAAVKFYEKFGFKALGILKKELKIDSKFYDEIIMEKFL